MYRYISTAVVALVLVGCGNSDKKDDRELISQTPEIKITQGVIKSQMVKESNEGHLSGARY